MSCVRYDLLKTAPVKSELSVNDVIYVSMKKMIDFIFIYEMSCLPEIIFSGNCVVI